MRGGGEGEGKGGDCVMAAITLIRMGSLGRAQSLSAVEVS